MRDKITTKQASSNPRSLNIASKLQKSKSSQAINLYVKQEKSQSLFHSEGSKSQQKIKGVKEVPRNLFIRSVSSFLEAMNYLMKAKPKGHSFTSDRAKRRAMKGLDKKSRDFKNLLQTLFKVANIDRSVVIFAIALFKDAVSLLHDQEFEQGEAHLIFCGCLYMSIKMLVDTERWFLEDFADLSGYCEGIVEKTEVLLLVEIFDFKTMVSEEEYQKAQADINDISIRLKRKRVFPKKEFLIKKVNGFNSYRRRSPKYCTTEV